MQKDLGNYRKSYEKSSLTEEVISDNPMELFQKWFYEVEASEGVDEPNAMTVSTIGLDGFPKNRVVLLKKYTYEGFIFYTNYESEKGRAITQNPNVCISFFWPNMERQIIIKGRAEKIAENLSKQSEVVPSREYLEKKLKALEKEYDNKEIERPKYWGGFIVKPISMEFWQGRPNRLHDRIRYSLQANLDWKMERLAP